MRVIYVEPGIDPRLISIPHTLSEMQALVGGMIEVVEPFDDSDVVLVCDECYPSNTVIRGNMVGESSALDCSV